MSNDMAAPAATPDGLGRRAMLRGGLAGGVLGGGALGGGVLGGLGTAFRPGAPAAAASLTPPFALFDPVAHPDLNLITLQALGGAAYGTAEAGEIVTAVNETNASGASYGSYFDAFSSQATRVEALADDELAAGHRVSARGLYLRAATYWNLVLFFILGTTQPQAEATVFSLANARLAAAAALFSPPLEQVRIPYSQTWLPGWFLRPAGATGRRPTVILSNGSAGQSAGLLAVGGLAAVERGYNALILEGPGQGAMLFERQVPYRPDWENVITPVVDYLAARPDVDPKKIAITGWSMGGESVLRAAAFEHRLAAVVADPGVTDAWQAWDPQIRALFHPGATKEEVNAAWAQAIPGLSATQRFTVMKRSELFGTEFLLAARAGRVFTDLWTLGMTIMQVACGPLVREVTSPTLVLNYQDETFYPGQATRAYDQLRPGLTKAFHTFTVTEGAAAHCAPMAPQVRNQVVYDWLDTILS